MGVDQTMSDFDQMQYQTRVAGELAHIIQTQKIPNALLFSGPESTGKKQAAFLFAKGSNCLNNEKFGCNRCDACRKIDAHSHPDILSIDVEKDKKIISITQVRQLGDRISSRPNEARFRMVLFLTADKMNIQAQNALLKMLEEPPEKTFFILLAVQPSKLLATIHSRCRKIRFKPLGEPVIEQYLREHLNIAPRLCRIASGTAGPDLKKAMQYCGAGEDSPATPWFEKRQWLLKTLASIVQSGTQASISTGLMLSAHMSRHPDTIEEYLAVIRTFFRDLTVIGFHPEKIVNLDFFDTFSDINQMISRTVSLKWLERMIETERRIASNSSPRLALDRFFLEIASDKGNQRV